MNTIKMEKWEWNSILKGDKDRVFRSITHLKRYLPEISKKGFVDVEVITPYFRAESTNHRRFKTPQVGEKYGSMRLTIEVVAPCMGIEIGDLPVEDSNPGGWLSVGKYEYSVGDYDLIMINGDACEQCGILIKPLLEYGDLMVVFKVSEVVRYDI